MTSLYALILIPLIAAVAIVLRPERDTRAIAMIGTLAALGATIWTMVLFNWVPTGAEAREFQFVDSFQWLPSFGGTLVGGSRVRAAVVEGGVSLSVGVDSVAMMLIALTVLLGPICVAASFSAITQRAKTYYAWLLVLQAAMTGVFAARDAVLFYICFEFTLIPMWILIHLYGSTNRKKAATKFFLYTFTGSLVALAGLMYVAWTRVRNGGGWDFDFDKMTMAAQAMSPIEQAWVLFALLAGFAVKVPLFPFHTWLPLAHTEAPTAGSVILAGVLLKLGTYGIYRFAIPFCPVAAAHYAPLIATVSIIGILYGGLICWVQTDVKKLVAYSSVAHLGFCILGMFSFNTAGLSGSVLYMINHGLSTGALFLLIGMIYERYHTRSMKELGGLAATMPVWATFMVFFAMASVGLPGLNGFVSEFLCLLGAFQAGSFESPSPGASGFGLGPWYAFIAGTGMIVAAMYLLFMVSKVVWGGLVEPHGNHGHSENAGSHSTLPRDLNAREICILLPLALACLALGVYPKPLLDSLKGPVNAQADTVAHARERAVHRMSAAPARTPEEAPR
jgi:NADH-quinone oxidoreductase subunit M